MLELQQFNKQLSAKPWFDGVFTDLHDFYFEISGEVSFVFFRCPSKRRAVHAHVFGK